MHNCRPRRQPTPAFRVVRHDALKSNASSIQFGLKDLVLTGDLTACSSELENSYGIGLAAGSEDAKVRACVPECITYAPFLPFCLYRVSHARTCARTRPSLPALPRSRQMRWRSGPLGPCLAASAGVTTAELITAMMASTTTTMMTSVLPAQRCLPTLKANPVGVVYDLHW